MVQEAACSKDSQLVSFVLDVTHEKLDARGTLSFPNQRSGDTNFRPRKMAAACLFRSPRPFVDRLG